MAVAYTKYKSKNIALKLETIKQAQVGYLFKLQN